MTVLTVVIFIVVFICGIFVLLAAIGYRKARLDSGKQDKQPGNIPKDGKPSP